MHVAVPHESLDARMKCLDPVTSVGPSAQVKIWNYDNNALNVGAERVYVPGSIVQVILNRAIFTGIVETCEEAAHGFVLRVVSHSF